MTTVMPVVTFEESVFRVKREDSAGHKAWRKLRNLFGEHPPDVNIVVGTLENLPKSCLKKPSDSVVSTSTTATTSGHVRFRKGFVTEVFNYPTNLDKDLSELRHVKYASPRYAKLCRQRRAKKMAANAGFIDF